MGKTTLAHVVANHCGYRPLEVNASDDRSAPVLREKIVSVLLCCVYFCVADGWLTGGVVWWKRRRTVVAVTWLMHHYQHHHE